MTKIATVSLGCPKNLVDSEQMLGLLKENGFEASASLAEAEVILVNTCAFIEDARRESLTEIGRLAAFKKTNCRLLAVAGCLVQYYGGRARGEIPGADILLGVGEGSALPRLLAAAAKKAPSADGGSYLRWEPAPRHRFSDDPPRLRCAPPHYAYLKIADGCDNRCGYCLIPAIRGPYQSRPAKHIIAEAVRLAAEGVKEIILVAQDTGYYGWEKGRGPRLTGLLEGLEEIDGIRWIRLLYAHPANLDRSVMKTMASSKKICPYLDLPIQHINDRILKRMGRPVSRHRIEALLDQLRELVPGISLRTTLMVGFPGEGEGEFEELEEFVRWQRFDHLGVFVYSREKGTSAARLKGRPDAATSARRRDRLLRLQKSISRSRLRRWRDRRIEVMIDGPFPEKNSELLVGRAVFQAPEVDGLVVVEGGGCRPGELVGVRVKETSAYDLYGEAAP